MIQVPPSGDGGLYYMCIEYLSCSSNLDHHCIHINHIYLGIVSDYHCTHINHIYLGIDVSDHHCTHIKNIFLEIVLDHHCSYLIPKDIMI